MKLIVMLLLACGGAPEAIDVPEPLPSGIEAGGPVKPYLSVNGETSPRAGHDWYPTGVAFDSRSDGWRLSCLNGRMPAIAVYGDGYLQLRCPSETRE